MKIRPLYKKRGRKQHFFSNGVSRDTFILLHNNGVCYKETKVEINTKTNKMIKLFILNSYLIITIHLTD